MPTISVQQSLLRTLMEAQGFVHDIEQVNDELPLLGTDIDACTEEQLDIEIFPDRPDLLSGETLAFAMANFLHGAPARPDMDVQPSGITMKVDSSLRDVRPVILGAVVRGVSLPDDSGGCEAFIKGLMDHQESSTSHWGGDANAPPSVCTTWPALHPRSTSRRWVKSTLLCRSLARKA